MTDQELIAPDLPQQRDPTNSTLGSGWYKVADSQDIGSMEAIQVDDFPTQIVVWRGADNQLRALDLYCKHMGASLACGEVEENGIRCPFMHGDGQERAHVMRFLMLKEFLLRLLRAHGRLMNLTVQFMFGLISKVSLQILMEKE